jgi:hypothetical protein
MFIAVPRVILRNNTLKKSTVAQQIITTAGCYYIETLIQEFFQMRQIGAVDEKVGPFSPKPERLRWRLARLLDYEQATDVLLRRTFRVLLALRIQGKRDSGVSMPRQLLAPSGQND